MSGTEPLPERARILVVRTSSLGDVVHALPVLGALRRHLPGARLGWVVEEPFAPLLAGHPDLDQLIVVRLRRWGRRPLAARTLAEIAAFLAAVDRFAPQVVLDLMGNHKAAVLAALSLAPRRIGHVRAARREPSSALWLSERVPATGTHVVDRALSLLDALGLPREPADFGSDKLFRGAPAAAGTTAAPGGPYVLLHPGAGWGNKTYPAAWWGEAARRLHAATGVRTLVAVGPGGESQVAAVVAAAGAPAGAPAGAAGNLGGAAGPPAAASAAAPVAAYDLPALAALARGAALVVGGDSGPTHLAHALGAPVLMVMGPTDPDRHGPYGAPERAIFRRLPCSFCYRRFDEVKACLLELPPERLAERAAALLEKTR